MRTIAVVEDERDQRENCADALRKHGYRVSAYVDRASALAGFAHFPPDLSILDVILGDEMNGGFELCRDLLAKSPHHPVIFLTTRADEISQVSGLTLGAWDYLAKPVSLRVLAEKVSTLLRLADSRGAPAKHERVFEVGSLLLNDDRMQVSFCGSALGLTLTEYRVLQALVRWPGRVVSYEALMEAAQQGIVSRNTVNTHIGHLRKKFKVIEPTFDKIENVYAVGYRWGAE
jgi:two-component system OmpR family response regulator